MSEHFTLRLPTATAGRLRRRAESAGAAPRSLAQRYVEEGLRRDEHPLIQFVDGPAGRRASLIGRGLDVWEVVATARDNAGDVDETAAYLGIPAGLVQAAISYYGAYRDEIDQFIARNEAEAERAHAAWLAGQQALSGA